MNKIELIKGDCLEKMDKLIEEDIKVDAIITDIPYNITNCDWDLLIPFNNYLMLPKSNRSKKLIPVYKDEYILRELKNGRGYKEICEYFDENSKEGMWQKLNKLIKDNGAIVLFGSEPFSSALRTSNIKSYKYDWIWEKNRGTGISSAKHRPMKNYENIIVFNSTYYYPIKQLTKSKHIQKCAEKGLKRNITTKSEQHSLGGVYGGDFSKFIYPKQVIQFNTVNNRAKERVHSSQKPVALMEYLIKTYTNENELVLDFTSGSCSTGIACLNTNRSFIGIEKDEKYFDIGVNRVKENMKDGFKLIVNNKEIK